MNCSLTYNPFSGVDEFLNLIYIRFINSTVVIFVIQIMGLYSIEN